MVNPVEGPEHELNKVIVLDIASQFAGTTMPHTDKEFIKATHLLNSQHKKVLWLVIPPGMTAQSLLTQAPEKIDQLEILAHRALDQGDIPAAIYHANHIFAYADISIQDVIKSRAFEYALHLHRTLVEHILASHAETDTYLLGHGQALGVDIEVARATHDYQKELGLLRTILHRVLLNGTLGEDAKRYFDPYAIMSQDLIMRITPPTP